MVKSTSMLSNEESHIDEHITIEIYAAIMPKFFSIMKTFSMIHSKFEYDFQYTL